VNHQRVMLIRAGPKSVGAARALEIAAQWGRLPSASLVFFQGPGLGHVACGGASEFALLASGGRLQLRVCRTGWQRLGQGPLPPPFMAGSLVQFWDAALEALDLRSFGSGFHD
jgi:hypothetical protein